MGHSAALEEFVNRVEYLHEIEYGDFKRKLSLYILRLEQNLQIRDPQAKQIITDMRNKVIFDGHGDIEEARAETLELAERLKYLV